MAQIDLENLSELIVKSDEIFLSAKGEKTLLKLLEIQAQVEAAIDEAKAKLEAAALKANPNFSSIQANQVKVYYRAFGAKYYIDEAQLNLAPKELYTIEEKINYKLDTKAIEKWVDQHGGMPTGIKEVERKKAISFGLKKNGGADNE